MIHSELESKAGPFMMFGLFFLVEANINLSSAMLVFI